MTKTYTAQEMRDRAEMCERYSDVATAAMLRQAAYALEREEKRKKKYEYAVEYYDKTNGKKVIGVHYKSVIEAKALSIKGKDLKKTYVRRAVGEWEEVKE